MIGDARLVLVGPVHFRSAGRDKEEEDRRTLTLSRGFIRQSERRHVRSDRSIFLINTYDNAKYQVGFG